MIKMSLTVCPTVSHWILQLAETYEMEFFETSASNSDNISEVGHMVQFIS